MNVLYLIGNGFDINWGLKTRYSQFYEYYVSQPSNNENIRSLKNNINSYIHNTTTTDILQYNWSDLEIALGEYAANCKTEMELQELYFDIYENLCNYIEKQEKLIPETHPETASKRLMMDLLRPDEHLLPLDKSKMQNYFSKWSHETGYVNIISFNYTTLLEKILNAKNENTIELGVRPHHATFLRNIQHIHGTIQDTPLMGVDSINQIHNDSFKTSERVTNLLVKPKTNLNLKSTIDMSCKRLIEEAQLICIFGMSLGQSDNTWWHSLSEPLQKKHVKIIYFVKGDDIPPRRRQLFPLTENENKNLLLSRIGIKETEQYLDDIYISYNSNMFNLK